MALRVRCSRVVKVSQATCSRVVKVSQATCSRLVKVSQATCSRLVKVSQATCSGVSEDTAAGGDAFLCKMRTPHSVSRCWVTLLSHVAGVLLRKVRRGGRWMACAEASPWGKAPCRVRTRAVGQSVSRCLSPPHCFQPCPRTLYHGAVAHTMR